MRPYPNINLGAEAWLQMVSEIRREDILEHEKLRAEASYEGGFKRKPLHITTSSSVGVADYFISANATSGNITITLLASPEDGQMHVVSRSDASGNTLTVDGNGNNINGAGTRTISGANTTETFCFIGELNEWRAY